MTKKIIAFILALVMVFQLQLIVVNAAEQTGDAASGQTTEEVTEATAKEEYQPYTEAVDLLIGFGITDGSLDLTDGVSRGMAAKLICSMLNENDNLLKYRGIFADVPENNEYALYIEKLADLGIVKGDGNYNYRPDAVISYEEVGYIFAYTMGYGLIQGEGESVIKTISRFGIMDNIRRDYDFVSIGDFFLMMKNALLSNLFVRETYGEKPGIYESEQTLLYKVYKIAYADGIITKTDVTSLWSAGGSNDDRVWIQLKNGGSDLKLKVNDYTKIREDLGKSVRVYYKTDNAKTDAEYVWHSIDSYNRTLNINLEMVENGTSKITASGRVSYYVNDRKPNIANLASSVNIIYNGVVYKNSNFDLDTIDGKVGNIELIDADGNANYETIKITAYDSVIVNNISTEHNYITDKYDTDKKINIDKDNYNKILIYDADGKETDFSAIVSGCIVSAAKSDAFSGNDLLVLRVSTKTLNGKITKYNKGTFVPYIVIDNSEKFNLFDRAAEKECKEKSSVITYVDVFGNAVYISDDFLRDMQYGILAGVTRSKGGFSPVVTARLIFADGEAKELEIDKKVMIDGVSYNDKGEEVYNALNNVKLSIPNVNLPQGVYPIRFKLDEDGNKIKKIDTKNTVEKSSDDSFEYMGGGKFYVNSGQIFGWTIPYSSDSIVLELSMPDYSDLSSYMNKNYVSVGTASKFATSSTYRIMAFKSDSEAETAEFIIRFTNAGEAIDYSNSLFVIDSIMSGYNEEEGRTMTQVSGYLNGSLTYFWMDNEFGKSSEILALKQGDIIRYNATPDSKIIQYEPILIRNDDGTYKSYDVSGGGLREDSGTSVTILCGYVYSMQNTIICTNVFNTGAIPASAASVDWAGLKNESKLRYTNLTSNIPVTSVDFDREKIEIGSIDNIRDYKNLKNDSSLFVARFRSGALREVVVYNK